MSQEPLNAALDILTEETARQIIFTCQPGATSDPLKVVKQLLLNYLENAREQEYQDAIRQQWEEEHNQQNSLTNEVC